jgi:DNA-binding NarL/FixJ family response regulator
MPESNMSLINILLVDSQNLLRAGLRLILETEPKFRVVGEASSREEALEGARLRPDIIILNLNSDGEPDLDLLSDLSITAERRAHCRRRMVAARLSRSAADFV